MPHSSSLKLPTPSTTFDNCLISACLNRLFTDKRAANTTTIDILKSIDDVPANVGALAGDGQVEMTNERFKLLERNLPDAGHRYAMIKHNGKPVLFAYYQLFTLTRNNFNLATDNAFTKGLIKLFTSLKRTKVLILGDALQNEKNCYCYDRTALSADQATEAVGALAERIAYDECASAILLKELPELTPATRKLFAGNGYIHPFEDNVMEMQVDPKWQTLADYLKDLGRKYKARANKILAAIDGVTARLLTDDEITRYEKDLHQLFMATVDQQPFTLTRPAQGFFTDMKALYKDAFQIMGYFKEGRLIGFYSAFSEPGTYNIYYIGFDYGENETHQIYFNILFTGLEQAILQGKGLLQLGRTSMDAKASLGAKARELNYLLKMEYIPDFVVNRFVKYFASFENAKWKQRNPLKNGSMA